MAIKFTIFPPGTSPRPTSIVFDMGKILVGRGSVCDLRLPHPLVSYHHATIESASPGYTIMDTGSTNGTRLNGAPVSANHRSTLRSDDVIEIAGFRIVPTLSVAMEGSHNEERTETIARSLVDMSDGSSREATLEIIQGPDAGLVGRLARGRGEVTVVGCGRDSDIVLNDPRLEGLRLEFKNGPLGWVLDVVRKGPDHGSEKLQTARIGDGKVLSLGSTRMLVKDSLDAWYRLLVNTRQDIAPEPAPAATANPANDVEETKCDPSAASAGSAPPPPLDGYAAAAPSPHVESVGKDSTRGQPGPISSKMVPVAGTNRSDPAGVEYSWVVVGIGALAFLASVALLLLLVF